MTIKTLLIGGGGYIGSHLVLGLIASGRQVTVVGRSTVSHYSLPKEVRYVCGDFGDHDLICSLLDEHKEVIHLAYATVPNTSFDDPLVDLLQNLPPVVQLFSEAAERGCRLVLVSSGGTVYGEAPEIPIQEDQPTNPISPYGVTKLTLEKYAHLYAVTHGLEVVIVRPANAFGVGQWPHKGQGFISTAMATLMADQPVKVYGERGTIRDYIYISDLASGIVRALEQGELSEIYNIGSGIGRSNMDVIEAISPIICSGGGVVVEYLPERVFDVQTNVLNSNKLQEHTGWKPEVHFSYGLLKTYEWLSVIDA